MPETKNPMTTLAEEVAEELIARARELAKTLEIPMGMERVSKAKWERTFKATFGEEPDGHSEGGV